MNDDRMLLEKLQQKSHLNRQLATSITDPRIQHDGYDNSKMVDSYSYIMTHPSLIPNSSACSLAASRLLLSSFSRDSIGNQSFIKLSNAQSRLVRSAVNTVGARHMGQLPLPRFCILTKHLTQNRCPHVNLIGLNAMLVHMTQE